MKKRVLRVILFSLISLLLLTSMLITAMLGNVKAEYFKSLSTSLDFEITEDLPLRYKIKDDNNTSGTVGVYTDSKSISQVIKLGATVTAANAIYEIEFPLSETGLHAVDFTVEFSKSGTTGDFFVAKTALASGYVKSLNNPVGCKFYSRSDFTNTYTRLIYDNEGAQNATGEIHARQPYNQTRTYNVNNNFQWKTLAPSRSENVTLSVNATTKKVYLCWDLRGLSTAGTYTLKLSNIKVTKVNTPDGPYMDFANMYYTNNALFPTASAAHSSGGTYVKKTGNPQRVTVQTQLSVSGKNEAGKTRQSMARGTYVTEATYDCMTMQAEKLAFGYENGEIITKQHMEDNHSDLTASAYSNILSFGIPIKNVKLETTYKLSFDLSIARQGGDSAYFQSGSGTDVENLSDEGNATYAPHADVLTASNEHFECYLYRGGANRFAADGSNLVSQARTKSVTYNISGATDKEYGRGQVVLNDKGLYRRTGAEPAVQSDTFKGQALISLNDAHKSTMSAADALLHWNKSNVTEYNGENTINWVKYSNLTTSFNLDEDWNSESELKNLALVWAIDCLDAKSWYRIKMENVRIEEVIQYGSAVTEVYFNGSKSSFSNDKFKGSNGTGQNFTTLQNNTSIALAAYNVYGPEFNANGLNFSASPNTRKIRVKGTAACYDSAKKGIEKYVWSADGGETWYDVESQTLSDATNAQLRLLEDKAENSMASGKAKVSALGTSQPVWDSNKKCEYADFRGCGKNSVFDITADITGTPYEFKNRVNIIFAMVPASNTDLRCEILIVKYYNDLDHYVSQIDSVVSDITVLETPTNLQITRDLNNNNNYTDDNVFKRSFVPMSGRMQNKTYATAVDDLGVYFYRRENTLFDNYNWVYTMCSDIPIKNTLTLNGVAILHGGISEYAYSIDEGNTWISIEHTMADLDYSGTKEHAHEKLLYTWLSTGNNYESAYVLGADSSNGDFRTSPLSIDLSEYVGKVLDIVVAAKGTRGRYCPIAKIDNVAVYGDPTKPAGELGAGMGPFYTRHYSVKVGTTSITPITNALDGTYLNGKSTWNIGFDHRSYTPYEPYNVDYMNVRKITQASNAIAAGGTVTIDGCINCYSGVKEYRYTLDGGNNWTVINQTVPAHTETSFAEAKFVDATFTIANDGGNSNFCTDTGYGGTPITVTLPSGVTGNKDLRVVAESNAGYIYPVLNIPLSIT